MNKIIKILGPSGAGKTTVVRELMKAYDVEPVQQCAEPGTKFKTIGYLIDAPTCIYVPGSYEANCGGVDTIDSAQKVMDDIEEMYGPNHVVYEGLLQSTYYGAMGKWSKQFGDDFIYLWLNTPLDVCMERLHARRAANGTKRPLNEEQAKAKWATVLGAWDRARKEGHRVEILHWEESSTARILELLK